jgi:hypothetical protein
MVMRVKSWDEIPALFRNRFEVVPNPTQPKPEPEPKPIVKKKPAPKAKKTAGKKGGQRQKNHQEENTGTESQVME